MIVSRTSEGQTRRTMLRTKVPCEAAKTTSPPAGDSVTISSSLPTTKNGKSLAKKWGKIALGTLVGLPAAAIGATAGTVYAASLVGPSIVASMKAEMKLAENIPGPFSPVFIGGEVHKELAGADFGKLFRTELAAPFTWASHLFDEGYQLVNKG